jgi:hypothetical protein
MTLPGDPGSPAAPRPEIEPAPLAPEIQPPGMPQEIPSAQPKPADPADDRTVDQGR